MSEYYKIQDFANLAGVTIKALHHYDRLGLLKPARTSAGYRIYTLRDLERLEQIVALKFLGVPLKQIKTLLEKTALALPDALRLQRKALEEKHVLLGRAIRAVREAEASIQPDQPANPAILKRIIEVIDVQNGIDIMKKYYGTEQAWEQRRRYYEEGPSQEWRDLYHDINAALQEDPACSHAQELADRWLCLAQRAYSGDPRVQTDSITAWMHRDQWPAAMKRRLAEFNLGQVNEFVQQAALSSRKKYFSVEGWAKWIALRDQRMQGHSTLWQERVDLFSDIEAALNDDPSGPKARALAARWREHLDASSGGDPEVKEGLQRGWADRGNWPATLRWLEESLCRLNRERFDQAANFLDRACSNKSIDTTGNA